MCLRCIMLLVFLCADLLLGTFMNIQGNNCITFVRFISILFSNLGKSSCLKCKL
uniref:Secreted protein n=1 Tax=Heterorhabditis bacteriophora TaxID=37862 RepID=A0A1I7WNC1_HETBA